VTATGGGISVTANSNPTIDTRTAAVALSVGIGVAGAGADSRTAIEVMTEAYLRSATLSATGHDVLVQATSTSLATPFTLGASGGALAINVVNAEASILGSTLAYVAGNSRVTADNLDVKALDTNTAEPQTSVAAAGLITINAATTDIQLRRVTEARVEENANLIMPTGSLNLQAISTSNSIGSLSADGAGLATINSLNVDASVASTTRAQIANRAYVQVSGTIGVDAVSNNIAQARTSSLGAGGLTFGSSSPTATVDSVTEALALGELVANTVRVAATGNDDRTSAGASSYGFGGIAIDSSTVTARTSPVVRAVGGGSILAGSNVTFEAVSNTDADAASDSTSVGIGVTVSDLNATVTVQPVVTVQIQPGTFIDAQGTLTLNASHGEPPVEFSDGSFDAASAAAVDLTADTITFAQAHGLQSGDTIIYESSGGNAIGGLTDLRKYGVLKTGDSSLALGALVRSGDVNDPLVDTQRDEINFAGPHNLESGDRVIYQNDGGAVIGGLSPGAPYEVLRIDGRTIKLINPATAPLPAAKSFSGADITGTVITKSGNGFSEGQAVTYRAPRATEFTASSVDVVGGPFNSSDPSQNLAAADNDNIFLPDHGFAAGDEVIYTAAEGTPIAGLANGRYFVIFDPAKPDEFQLAETLAQAIGSDNGTPGDTGDDIAITPIPLTPDANATGVTLSLRRVADQPIGGLEDGVTYYIHFPTAGDPTKFELARDAARTDIATLDPRDPVSNVLLSGTSTLGTEGIDITARGTDSHRLILDLTARSTGTQRLDGVGGARALVGAPAGDGVATASATGSGGGIVRVSGASTTARAKPSVIITIGDAGSGASRVILSANDIVVAAESIANASSSSANSGGGLVSVGDAVSRIEVSSTGEVRIAEAELLAVNSLRVNSSTNVSGTVLADANGGGLVDFADARVSSTLDYSSLVDIGPNTILQSEELVSVGSASTLTSSATALADSKGLGASADASAPITVGSSGDRARTLTQVGHGAVIRGKTVELDAHVNGLTAVARADANAAALGANTDAGAPIDIYNVTEVRLSSGSAVSGRDVDVSADQLGVSLSSTASADCDCGFGDADSTARAHFDSSATVSALDGSNVSASDLDVEARQVIAKYDRRATSDVAFLGGESEKREGDLNAFRSIDWNASVTLLAGLADHPKLLVGADGAIVEAVGVTVNGGLGQGASIAGAATVSVDAIANDRDDAGTADFVVNQVANAPAGEIRGSTGSFSSASAFTRVEIENQFDAPLIINGIDVVSLDAKPAITLDAQTVSIQFDVDNRVPPGTEVEIIHAAASNDIRIQGVINNPLGSTLIQNTAGDILKTGSGLVRSAELDLDAANGALGTAANPLRVELIRTVWGPSRIDALAKDDIHLVLAGRVRDPDLRADFTSRSIQAGGDVDIEFETVLQQLVPLPGTSNLGIDVTVVGGPAPQPRTYRAHFPNDPNPVPDIPLDPRVFPDPALSVGIDAQFRFDNMVADNITLVATHRAAADPKISIEARTDVRTDQPTGDIEVRTNGNIAITERGDLPIDAIISSAGDVSLTATGPGASIFEIAPDDPLTAYVQGNSITLSARGGIGDLADFLEIDSSVQAPGVVQALAGNGVFLREVQGDLNLVAIASDFDDVVLLVPHGSIFEGSDDPEADIQGRNIDLWAPTGAIGTRANPIELYGAGIGQRQHLLRITTAVPDEGRLFAVAEGDIHLAETNAALLVLKVASNSGDVSLSVLDTVLLDNAFAGPYGEDLVLLTEPGASLLGEAVASGLIQAAGSIELHAGDNVVIPQGTSVVAGVAITITGDSAFADPDPDAGTNIDLAGDISAPTVTVSGGRDIDYIQISNPQGIDADAVTLNGETHFLGDAAAAENAIANARHGTDIDETTFTLTYDGQPLQVTVTAACFVSVEALRAHVQAAVGQALAAAGRGVEGDIRAQIRQADGAIVFVLAFGDDRFFIPIVRAGSTMTVNGGQGADRYYVSSDAARERFMENGFFDDDVDPLSRLEGTLENIAGALTIHTGLGGNQGTRDAIYVSAAGAVTGLSGSLQNGVITGLGMPASLAYTSDEGTSLLVRLGAGDDAFRIQDLAAPVAARIYAGPGADRLTVAGDDDRLDGISGIVAFFGEDGDDTLDVYGDGPADQSGLLTAIGLTGLEMGGNSLFSVHDEFGAELNVSCAIDGTCPGAIYFAQRTGFENDYTSTVETVNLFLGDNDDTLRVDSLDGFGTRRVFGGDGDDTLIVGSSEAGLFPASPGRVDFIEGDLVLDAQGGADDRIVVDDSGDTNPNIGSFVGATVYGLDMAGQITFANAENLDILLGAQDDIFYVPATNASQPVTLNLGGGFDTAYVGTTQGHETSGSLDGILGALVIQGEGPEAGDRLFLNDYDTATGQTFTIDNAVTGSIPLLGGGSVGDVTVALGSGDAIVFASLDLDAAALASAEAAVAAARSGNDLTADVKIDVEFHGQMLSIRAAAGSFATAEALRAHLQAAVDQAITREWPIDSTTVLRSNAASITYQRMETVVLNAGSGADQIDLHATHRELDPKGGKASTFVVNAGAGDDAINLGRPQGDGFTLDPFQIETDLLPRFDGFRGIPVFVNGQDGVDRVHYRDSATPEDTLAFFLDASFADIFPADPATSPPTASQEQIDLFAGLLGEDPLAASYFSAVFSRAGARAPVNVRELHTEDLTVSLGAGDDVLRLLAAAYARGLTFHGGAGGDTFTIENGVDLQGNALTINGEAGDDLVFADFAMASLVAKGALGETLVAVVSPGVVPKEFLEIDRGRYYVETRQESAEWQFRLVDQTGTPLVIATADGSGRTDAWQNISDLDLADQRPRLDTKRGFLLEFGRDAASVPGRLPGGRFRRHDLGRSSQWRRFVHL
jgi:hypothetical protein